MIFVNWFIIMLILFGLVITVFAIFIYLKMRKGAVHAPKHILPKSDPVVQSTPLREDTIAQRLEQSRKIIQELKQEHNL